MFESTSIKDGTYRTASSSSNPETTVAEKDNFIILSREVIAWNLVIILSVLLLVSSVIHVMQAVCFWAHKRKYTLRNLNTSPDCIVTTCTDSNLCHEAVSSKLYEAQEAVHVYESVKEMKLQ